MINASTQPRLNRSLALRSFIEQLDNQSTLHLPGATVSHKTTENA